MTRRLVDVGAPYNLQATVRSLKWSLFAMTIRSRRSSVERATRTPDGPAAGRYTQVGDDVVEVEAWGPGAEWLLEQAPVFLGAFDDPESFEPEHRLLRDLHKRQRGARFGGTHRIFEAIVPVIIGQKVTGKEAAASLNHIGWKFTEPAPGEVGVRLPPTAEQLAALPYYDYHPLGIEKKRADVIRRVARLAERLERLIDRTPEQVEAGLQEVRGIGPWTSAIVRAVALGDADAVPVGDFHIKHMVSWALAGEPRGTDERMLELLEPYRPHRGRVVRLLETGGIKEPAFGPRVAVRTIAEM